MSAPKDTNLKNTTFRKIMRELQPSDSSLENVFLEADWGKHRISVYALPDDNYTLIVEDFGYESKGVWHQAEPTGEQLQQLQKAMQNELNRLYAEEDESYELQQDSEDWHQDIQHTYNHINNNFYSGY